MDQSYINEQTARRGPGWKALLLLVLAAMALGGAGMWWLLRGDGAASPLAGVFDLRGDRADPELARATATARPSATPTAATQQVAAAVERVEEVVEQQGGLDARLAAMEQRLTRLDLQAQAAAGNAARAESLLIAFATRRALERGAPLGYLEDQLRLRFADAQPNAVRTVIAAAANPVTLDQLLARLDGLAPQLSDAPADEGVLDWLGRELSTAFVVRREDTPSPLAESRLVRARLFLESSRPEAAIAEVRALPNAAAAQGWIADATRYARAQEALELLETTAVLEPRDLRDGAGDRVAQPGPAG